MGCYTSPSPIFWAEGILKKTFPNYNPIEFARRNNLWATGCAWAIIFEYATTRSQNLHSPETPGEKAANPLITNEIHGVSLRPDLLQHSDISEEKVPPGIPADSQGTKWSQIIQEAFNKGRSLQSISTPKIKKYQRGVQEEHPRAYVFIRVANNILEFLLGTLWVLGNIALAVLCVPGCVLAGIVDGARLARASYYRKSSMRHQESGIPHEGLEKRAEGSSSGSENLDQVPSGGHPILPSKSSNPMQMEEGAITSDLDVTQARVQALMQRVESLDWDSVQRSLAPGSTITKAMVRSTVEGLFASVYKPSIFRKSSQSLIQTKQEAYMFLDARIKCYEKCTEDSRKGVRL